MYVQSERENFHVSLEHKRSAIGVSLSRDSCRSFVFCRKKIAIRGLWQTSLPATCNSPLLMQECCGNSAKMLEIRGRGVLRE